MEHLLNVDQFVHDFRLADVSWNAVEHENINIGLEGVRIHGRVDLGFPEFHGDLVRDELPFARILQKSPAHLRAGIDRPKDVSTGAMEKAGNAAKRAALGAFAAARRAEEEVGLVFHEQISFLSQKQGAAQPIRCGSGWRI
jgi:hypothetical protein